MYREVRTTSGTVRGSDENGIAAFRGIPFAAPPFGANRFRPPVAPSRWDGVREALHPGPGVPQPTNDSLETRWAYTNPIVQDEDCLNLSVWTPGGSGLPVMLWIHGGGFMTGGGSTPSYDGTTFARDGVVYVTINYRMHVDGFLYLGEGTENLGLLDQIAALQWVQDNITAFGGDPANVTVFGQSAGAVSIMELLGMPAARGLFRRAIAQSGCSMAGVTREFSSRVAHRLADMLGVVPSVDGFSSVPMKRLLKAVMGFAFEYISPAHWGADSLLVSGFRPYREAPLRTDPDVDVMAGTTRDETTFALQPFGMLHEVPDWWMSFALDAMGIDAGAIEVYRKTSRPDANEAELVQAAWTDWAFRIPTIRLLESHRGRSWCYEFCWPSPVAGLGAIHAIDVPFVFDGLAGFVAAMGDGENVLGTEPPQELADVMHKAWVDFATHGDPGWAAYDQRRTTMRFDVGSETIEDLAGAERELWNGIR